MIQDSHDQDWVEQSCVSTLPPDQEEALAWQGQSGPLGQEQREIPGLVLKCFKLEQGVGPAGQRHSRERAERGSRSCLY